MTRIQKQNKELKETIQLIHDADRLLLKALRISGKNKLFGDKIVDAQLHLDDAITYLAGK